MQYERAAGRDGGGAVVLGAGVVTGGCGWSYARTGRVYSRRMLLPRREMSAP
jgi:hypothetical protein